MNPASLATLFARPLVKYGAIALAVVLVVLGFKLWLSGERKEARQEGITTERTEGMGRVIINVEKANEARREVADPGSRAKYDQCMLSATNPEVCKRFLPE